VSKATKILLAAALALGGLIVSVAAEIPEDLWSTAKKEAFEDAARAVDATRGTHKIRAETIANI
jgi:hypothetical protein